MNEPVADRIEEVPMSEELLRRLREAGGL